VRTGVADLVWLDRFDHAKQRAKSQAKPIAVKPFDQGLVSDEHW
jgi:hypothetical protein